MGLDTLASRTPGRLSLTDEDERAFDGLELCGGIVSGGGGSFRGKVYDGLVLGVTGVSLYQEWIPPETVGEMAEALERCDAESVAEPGSAPEVVRDLARFFRICDDRGLGLIGWW